MDGLILDTRKIKKPIYLQVGNRSCAPCVAELPALNDIVEEYSDRIEFILLDTDRKAVLEKVADQYSDKVNLIHLPEKENKDRKGNMPYRFSGFKHLVGSFPINYLITTDRKIIELTGGATIPRVYINQDGDTIVITKKDAYQKNRERLQEEMKILLGSN